MANGINAGYLSLNEEIVLDRLPIKGTLPGWLAGSLLRNGPAKFELGPDTFRHWFDGFAMLHRFTLKDGQVSYANKFLQSEQYKISMEQGRIVFGQFATDPCKAIFKGTMTETDSVNANVSINKVAGDFVAMTETPLPIAFNPHTLETLGVVHYEDALQGHHGSAHPHYDFQRHMSVSYMTEFNMPSIFHVYAIPDHEHRRQEIGRYALMEPSYLHSFGLTEQYIVIVEFPYRVNPLNLLNSHKPFIENYEWRPQEPATFVIMRKSNGEVVGRYETEAFFAFHHVNAFEQAGEVVVDISAYDSPAVIQSLYLDQLRDRVEPATQSSARITGGELRRYHVPLGSAPVRYELLSHEAVELPTINYRRYNAGDYAVVYGVSTPEQRVAAFSSQLVRVDLHGALGSNTKIWGEEACYPGEPIFAEAPDARFEDDGVILSVVLDARVGRSFLLVLNAHTFEEIARAEVPHHIPLGFHGEFFPSIAIL
ncbi:carotenoid oxygenase family protein [Dictyobacter kobayashii]|uniref:15,15' beta carotene dioxygenase n=1 Tax=Dictyobacter kobayashii TaxID=2014872 RepID=A0A402AUS3_9CHLR|nr:carotenoid oxygenase family protein [Dictyobacter kobayashii]GCE22868.1 15,15' beta carotene dioxygenase [Dictyobacter kobayashii]